MAKRSQRRTLRYEKDQSGCMWGLISIFDFRHGRSTQKLLADRRRGSSRHAAGSGKLKDKLDMLTNPSEDCGRTLVSIQDEEEKPAAIAETGKPSVKKLIEEEMFNEQDIKEADNAEVELKQANAEQGVSKKKNHRRMRKNRKKSSDEIQNLEVAEQMGSTHPCHQKSEYSVTDSLDLDNIMEEFCHRIHQRSLSCTNCDQLSEVHVQSNKRNPDFKENLSEAIKSLINQKLSDKEHLAEDGEIHPSRELVDVLQILSSNEELLLKLLQNPNSLLLTDVQDLNDAKVEKEEDSTSLAGSNLSEQELSARKFGEPVNKKQHNFFRRKVKSGGKNVSNGNTTSQGSNRIVVLKPAPMGSQHSENRSDFGSSEEPHDVVRNKGPNERVGSHFSLTEIKRKLKHAMGKEQHKISTHGVPKPLPYDLQNFRNCDKGFRDNAGRSSLSKDHFYIEKIARPPVGVKKGDKVAKDYKIGSDNGTCDYPKQRVSNIYIEAKKHLSEMLSNGDEIIDFSSRQVPKTLGRILSLPEYNFSPLGSPGRNLDRSFVTAQTRFSASDFLNVNENARSPKQDNQVNHSVQTTNNLENPPCATGSSLNDKAQELNSNSDILVEHVRDGEGAINCSKTHDTDSEGDVEILEAIEIVVQEESQNLDSVSGPSSFPTTKDDESGVMSKVCDEGNSKSSEQDSREEGSSSPFASPSNSPTTRKIGECENSIDLPERASPVSVLEPLFTEEDISPASTRKLSAETLIQPQQIQFEEHDSLDANLSTHAKTCIEGKESISKYIKALLEASCLNWDEIHLKLFSSEQLLYPSLFDEVQFFPNQLCHDQKLLFDCINEVLLELSWNYFGCSPFVSFVKPKVQSIPNIKNAVHEILERVNWHVLPLPLPHTLEQIVRKDMAQSGTWMDLRFDTDAIGTEMGEAILSELLQETILNCATVSLEGQSHDLPVDLEENVSSIDL